MGVWGEVLLYKGIFPFFSMKKEKKIYLVKGNAEAATGAIITLISGIAIAVLLLIMIGTLGGEVFKTAEPDINSIASWVENETYTVHNGTPQTLSHAAPISSLQIYNATSMVAIPRTSYQLEGDGNVVNWTDSHGYNNTLVSAYYYEGNINITMPIKSSIINSFIALEKTGKYLPIIVLAVIIGLVLVMILGLGLTGRQSGGNSAL